MNHIFLNVHVKYVMVYVFLSCLWRPMSFSWTDFKIVMKSFLVQTKLENNWPQPHFIIIAQPESSGKSRSNTRLTMKIAWLSLFKGPLFEDPKWRFWTLNKSIWQLKPPRHSVAKIIPATHCTKLIKQKPAAAQCCSKHACWSFCIYETRPPRMAPSQRDGSRGQDGILIDDSLLHPGSNRLYQGSRPILKSRFEAGFMGRLEGFTLLWP